MFARLEEIVSVFHHTGRIECVQFMHVKENGKYSQVKKEKLAYM